MSSLPHIEFSNIFNPNDFTEIDSSLNLAEADARYFKIAGGFVSGYTTFLSSIDVIGTLSINGSPIDLSFITGITAGTASASKALVVDASLNITGINSLSATSLIVNGTSISSTDLAYLSGITPGTASASKALVVNSSRNIVNINSLTATTLVGTLSTAAQPAITSVGTLTSLTSGLHVSNSGSEVFTPGGGVSGTYTNNIRFAGGRALGLYWDTSTSDLLFQWGGGGLYTVGAKIGQNGAAFCLVNNMAIGSMTPNASYKLEVTGAVNITTNFFIAAENIGTKLTLITNGTAAASKALILDASRNIVNINSLTATTLVGTIGTAAQTSITSLGTLTSLSISGNLTMGSTTITESEIGVLVGVTPGTASASKALVLDASSNITGINSLSSTTLVVNGTSISSTDLAYLASVTPGTASASKALIVDSSRDIVNINSLSTTSLIVNGVSIVSSDLAYLSGITPGTVTASKAVVVDANKRITGIDRINITSSNATATTGTTTASNFALNILSTVNSNGQYNSQGIAFLNAASDAIPHGVIQSVRTAAAAGDIVLSTRSAANNLSENLRILSTGALSINYGASPNAMLSCIGSASYSSASYQRLLRLETSNASPIQFGVHLNLNTSATITNATFLGNLTANDLHFGTNTSAFVALKHTGSMMVIGGTTAISSTHQLEVLGSTLITDSTNTYTMPATPAIGVMNGAHAHTTRIEYQTMGKYVSSSDYSAWTTSIYYQNVTGDTANYISWCPSAKTSTSTGWGMVMNRNGQVSFQDSNTNSGSGGLVVGGNIVAAVDIYGGVTRFIGANGVLRSNATPAVYNAGGGSTRIGLYVVNAIWTADQVYASSDRRLKRNIKPVPLDEAKKLLNVQGVKYRWKKDMDGDKEVNHYGSELGVIAQDLLEQDLFRLVSYLPDNDKEKFPLGYHYGVSYDRMTVYLLEIVKDLYKRIEALESTPNRSTFNH